MAGKKRLQRFARISEFANPLYGRGTAVVNHYNTVLPLGLTSAQKTDLVEFLKTL